MITTEGMMAELALGALNITLLSHQTELRFRKAYCMLCARSQSALVTKKHATSHEWNLHHHARQAGNSVMVLKDMMVISGTYAADIV